ncbi:MAG: integrin alpha [Bacteroidales bacterium]
MRFAFIFGGSMKFAWTKIICAITLVALVFSVLPPPSAQALGTFAYQVNGSNGWWVLVEGWDYRYVHDWNSYFKLLANDPDRLKVVHTVSSQYYVNEWTQRFTKDGGAACSEREEGGYDCPPIIGAGVEIFVNGAYWKTDSVNIDNANGGEVTHTFTYPGRINSVGYRIFGFGSNTIYFRETKFYKGDLTAPTNPTLATEKGSATGITYTTSGSWQNWRNDPYFVWPGASDAGTGVNGYQMYWGPSTSSPSSTGYQTVTSYDPTNPAVVTTGRYDLWVSAKDNVNNVAQWTRIFEFYYDNTLPTVSISANPPTWSKSAIVEAIASDPNFPNASGIYTTACSDNSNSFTEVPNTSSCTVTVTTEDKTIYAYAKDKSRDQNNNYTNKSQVVSITPKVDITPPNLPSLFEISGTGCSNFSEINNKSQNVCARPTIKWTNATDAKSGVDGYNVYWGSESTGATGTYQSGDSFTIPAGASGTNYLRLQVKDKAGNLSGWTTIFVHRYETTAPTVSVTTTPAGWTKDGVEVNASATDDGSGVAMIYCKLEGDTAWNSGSISCSRTATTSGITFSAYGVDQAGNISLTTNHIVSNIDKDPPSLPTSFTISGEGCGDYASIHNKWQNTCATPIITWVDAADSKSGLDDSYLFYWGSDSTGTSETTGTGNSFQVPKDSTGKNFLRLRLKDKVGNMSPWATILIHQYKKKSSWTLLGDQALGGLGQSVNGAGDINGDQYDDVLLSAPGYGKKGRVYLYTGSASGLGTTSSWMVEGELPGSCLGTAAAGLGDVNNDGYADVLLGDPCYAQNKGKAYLYYGSAGGLATTPSWTAALDQAGSFFGYAVSGAGDVNHDGYRDVMVGAPRYDHGETDEGGVFVYYGSANGLSSTPSWTAEGNQTTAYFGFSLAPAGDVNGDTFADVIIGAPNYNHAQAGEGAAYVYMGSTGGLQAAPGWSGFGGQAGANYGAAVASAGNINGDAYTDILVGAPNATSGQVAEGKVYLFTGAANGLGNEAAWSSAGGQANAQWGASLAGAGDLNQDGYGDILIGAPGYSNGEAREGLVSVYSGSASGITVPFAWQVEGDQAYTGLGYALSSAGDVNKDGIIDVVIGLHLIDGSQVIDAGQANLYSGR